MAPNPTLIALLRAVRRKHVVAEDCWYTCPKVAGDWPGDIERECCDDEKVARGECTCGADEHNAKLDELAIFLGVSSEALR